MSAFARSFERRSARALLLLALVAPVASAETRSASQLTCLIDSGDVLATNDAGETASLLGGGFDFEQLASRRSARNSRLRLASSLQEQGFFPGITTHAVLRLDTELNPPTPVVLRDAGSRLGVAWQGAGLRAELRAYPFDTDYVRVGYLHALDWGGTNVEQGESVFVAQQGGAPGAELELASPRARLGLATKWARADAGSSRDRRRWGALLRGSFDFVPELRLEAGLGYFQRETRAALTSGASFVEGASVRLLWHRGAPEPELAAEPFRPPTLRDEAELLEAPRPGGLALAIEGVTLVRRLRDFEVPERSGLSASPALGIYGSARGRRAAVHLVATWRSLAFVLRNAEGLVEGSGLPARALARSELAAWLGVSATLLPWHLVPSLELGCLVPAVLQTQGALPGVLQTFVVRGPGQIEALPLGAERLPILAGRVGFRLQLSAAFALGLFASYEHDANRVRLASRAGGAARVFATPSSARLLAAAWSRF
jgi:hypothetical protein